jgi:DNA-directed RNA polymerase subunit K/omega
MRSTIVENNFLKVLIVTQRAKQIQKGGRPRIEMRDRRATRIALEEVERGLIGFDFLDAPLSPEVLPD